MQTKPVIKSYSAESMLRVPLKNLVDHPEIPYRKCDDAGIEELSKSIGEVGLNTPLIVWNGGGEKGTKMALPDGSTPPATFLVAGTRRRAALAKLRKRDLPRFQELFSDGIPVYVIGGTKADALAALIRENVMREEMTSEQIFPALNLLLSGEKEGGEGLKKQDVARMIGRSPSWVSQVLAVERELGEDGKEALAKGEIGLSAARKAASDVAKAKKAGKPVDAKAVLRTAKDKVAARKSAGKQRASGTERRLSAKVLYRRYIAHPKMGLGESKAVLEAALAYLAGDDNAELPEELSAEIEEADEKPTKGAKADEKAAAVEDEE